MPSAPPRRPGPTSAWCPNSPSRATRPRTCSSSPASWPTTWPRSRRWRRPPRDCAVVVGFVAAAPGGHGLANAAAVCARGRVAGVYRKQCLPNYGVFDEQRYFEAGTEPPTLFHVAGAWVGVSICEDVWFDDGPVAHAGRAGADVVVNLNASPYNRGRRRERLAMLEGRVAEAGCAIAYVNQVGGQDELVFDGDSLIMGADGTLLASGAQFATDFVRRRPAARPAPDARRDRAPAHGSR